jgi:hypothetical protein
VSSDALNALFCIYELLKDKFDSDTVEELILFGPLKIKSTIAITPEGLRKK